MRTPQLETERLILRVFTREDAEAVFYGWETDPDVAKYMMWESHNDIEKTKAWLEYEIDQIEKDDWYRWALIEKGTNKLIGTCIIHYSPEDKAYAIGYNLSKNYWGQGFVTEAMKEVLSFAKENLKIKEVIAAHAVENPASGKVMQKLGMVYVGDCEYICNGGNIKTTGKVYKIIL